MDPFAPVVVSPLSTAASSRLRGLASSSSRSTKDRPTMLERHDSTHPRPRWRRRLTHDGNLLPVRGHTSVSTHPTTRTPSSINPSPSEHRTPPRGMVGTARAPSRRTVVQSVRRRPPEHVERRLVRSGRGRGRQRHPPHLHHHPNKTNEQPPHATNAATDAHTTIQMKKTSGTLSRTHSPPPGHGNPDHHPRWTHSVERDKLPNVNKSY